MLDHISFWTGAVLAAFGGLEAFVGAVKVIAATVGLVRGAVTVNVGA